MAKKKQETIEEDILQEEGDGPKGNWKQLNDEVNSYFFS